MANPAPTLDELLQESRKKRKAADLAQEIFGKKNRSSTPTAPRSKPSPGASLASRVGVAKPRTASLPRSNTAPPPRNNARPAPQQRAPRPALNDNFRSRSSYANQPSSDPVSDAKSNGYSRYEAPQPQPQSSNGTNTNINFRGAAAASAGPHTVIAQNFAPDTSAEDIASVMADVGGQLVDCFLIAERPTVIAEITFAERSGAEAVINTFNGKKADGRTLNVYMKAGGGAKLPPAEEVAPPADEAMELDENAQSREAEDRLREQRRGGNDRSGSGGGGFPTGPRQPSRYEDDYYSRGPRRAEPAYQDGRYGFGGGYRGYRSDGPRYGGRGGGGGQSWRP